MLNEKSVRKLVHLRLSQEMAIKRLAAEEGLTEAEVIRRALDNFLAERIKGKAIVDPVLALVGAFKGDPGHDSRTIDDDLYGDVP